MTGGEREPEAPAGTYLLTVSLAQQAYRLSAFCRSLMDPKSRTAFQANPESAMRAFGLSETEMRMILERDWLAMVRYGVTHFLVFRVAGALGVGLVGVAAQMRGETLDEFRRSRRVWEER